MVGQDLTVQVQMGHAAEGWNVEAKTTFFRYDALCAARCDLALSCCAGLQHIDGFIAKYLQIADW